SDKIDKVLADERRIKSVVLNGHVDQHHEHHEWLAAHMDREKRKEKLCQWVESKIEEESKNEESRRKIRDGIAEKIIWAAASAIGTLIVVHYIAK
ncbi:MAG: hypothetical protein NHG36_06835, partial [Chromatiaceae bacterium]|nr:hypothetical protein [Candidatus Thioaporhodococcus sediminis]